MKPYAVKCPNCSAELLFNTNDTTVKCSYCGGIIYRKLDLTQRKENADIIKNILSKKEELKKAEERLAEFRNEKAEISRRKYVPSPTESLNNMSDEIRSVLLMAIPIFFAWMALAILDESGRNGLLGFIVCLVVAIATIPLFLKGKKELKETKEKSNETNKKIENERHSFEKNKSDDLKTVELNISKQRNLITEIEKGLDIAWLPQHCQSSEALKFIYSQLQQGKCDTIEQAIENYEDKLNHW